MPPFWHRTPQEVAPLRSEQPQLVIGPTTRLYRIFCIFPLGTCLPIFFATPSMNPSGTMILPYGEDRRSIGFFLVFAYKTQATALEHRLLLNCRAISVIVAWRFFSCCFLAMSIRSNNAAGTGERTAQRFASPAPEGRDGAWPC